MDLGARREKRLTSVWVEAVWLLAPLYMIVAAGEFLPERYYPDAGDVYTGASFLLGFTVLSLVAVVNLAVQYITMRSFDARPGFAYLRFTLSSAPGTPWIAEDHKFSRDQFSKILLWPALASSAVLALCFFAVPIEPWWAVGAVPLLVVAARNLLYSALILKQAPDTLVEERREGTILYEPHNAHFRSIVTARNHSPG